MDPVIRIRGLKKIYTLGGETVAALDGIDLDVAPGEYLAIMASPAPGNPPCSTFSAASTAPLPAATT